jgi:predicted nucleic acid-binding protein
VAVFLDTNVLIYSIGTAPSEIAKREAALRLLDRSDCVLSVQVLQEFYVQATHASRNNTLDHETAIGLIEAWCRFPVQENTLAVFRTALDLRKATGFSCWDCAIIAAAQAAGCAELHSEDMTHDRKVGGLRIVNPFRGL